MKRKIKKIFAVCFAMIIVFQVSLFAFAGAEIPTATSDFYVNDFAKIFTTEEKRQLMEKALSLANNYDGIQVVVTTITSLNGDTIENYAFNMYKQYGIGKNDMGLLILLSTKDRKIRVEVGRAMEAYVNDSKAGRFIDKYAIPYLKEDNFSQGLINLQKNLIDEIVKCVETEKNKEVANVVTTTKNESPKKCLNIDWMKILFWFLAIIISAGFVILIVLIVKKAKAKKEKTKRIIKKLRSKLSETKTKLRIQQEEQQKILFNEKERFFREKNEIIAYNSDKIDGIQSKLDLSEAQRRKSDEECRKLRNELSQLQDKYRRVNILYPNAEKDVENMIIEEIKQANMEKAREVDEAILKVINLPANKDSVEDFSNVISKYSNLTEEQKQYLNNDINPVCQLRNSSLALRKEYERKIEEENNRSEADNAFSFITSVIAGISVGTAMNLSKLQAAKKTYNSLSYSARKYFDDSIMSKVSKLLSEAEKDKEIEEYKQSAKKAERKINSVISGIYSGKARHLRELNDALGIYEHLDRNVKKYFDKSILSRLNDLISQAKRDKRREEEEEERRRRNAYSSSSSYNGRGGFGGSGFGGSSGFGGFGGRPGGGGASRGF